MSGNSLRALMAAACVSVPLHVSAGLAEPVVVRSSVPLPGGSAALSDALGSPRPFDRAFVLLEAVRILHENPPGESRETDARRRQFAAYLKSLRIASPRGAGAVETVPLPLTPKLWSDAIVDRRLRDDEVALAILEDREASFLYVGLSALDDETIRALVVDRKTLQVIYKQHAAVFAAFSGSFRVRDGRVQLPGGEDARPLWESITKQPASSPAQFLLALLGAGTNAGRLAFLYDTVAGLDERTRRYVLALDRPEPTRSAHFEAMNLAFATAQPGWHVDRRPYTRPPLDGTLIFRWLRLDTLGRPVGPLWPLLLDRAFQDLPAVLSGTYGGEWLPDDAALAVEGLDPTARVEPAWLADRLLGPLPQIGRQRLDALLFGQRVFPAPDPKDAADILLAMRGRIVFPTLVMTLERMGVRDPVLYALAVRHAGRFIHVPDAGGAAVALAQFQASLFILERTVRERTLGTTAAHALVRTLLALEPDQAPSYRGAIARWYDEVLLPALWQATGESFASSSAESGVLKGVAGDVPWPERPRGAVTWEGHSYHINRGATELRRLRSLRDSQDGPTLDEVLAFCRAVADGLVQDSPDESLIGDVVAVREALRGLAPPEIGPRAGMSLPDAQALTMAAIERANARDRRGTAEALRPLVSYGDALLADVLTSIIYVVCLGPPDSPALAGGNVALRHDFQLAQPRRTPWDVPLGWAVPAEDSAGGWHVTGSLLALDLGLARFSLRWLSADALPPMPHLNANERLSFAHGVVLANLFDFIDVDRDRLAEALQRGRQRMNALETDSSAIDAVASDAHLSGRRREALRWMLANDRPSAMRTLSLLEQLWLGGGADLGVDAWGMSAFPTTGCACPAFPDPGAWEILAGRPASGLIATRVPDLTLRIAQELHARGLPAALVPGILAVAMNDLVHEARPAHHDDWPAIIQYVADLPSDRFIDYISSLTATGPLVPVGTEGDWEDP